jgi:Patatin-like phospholipase
MLSCIKALFLDVPSLIDTVWRRTEYAVSAACDYRPGPNPKIAVRPFYKEAPFWLFAITVFFVSYGPTWSGMCATLPVAFTDFIREYFVGWGLIAASVLLFLLASRTLGKAIQRRFARIPTAELTLSRRAMACVVTYAGLIGLMAIGVWAGAYISAPSDERACAIEDGSILAFVRFTVCIAAIAVFAWIAHRRVSVAWQVRTQAAILVVVALFQWFALAGQSTVEASDLPYRHLFAAWAPAIFLVVAAAPWFAWRIYQGTSGVPLDERCRLKELFRDTELFVNRREPILSGRLIGYALVYGPAYRPLHLLLLPALVAFVAPAQWLYLFAGMTFVISYMLLVWGNVAARWQDLIIYIERWFLRGTPLLISLFVIVVAVLRLLQVDYISTILDSLPFGMAFGVVAMNYVLFWLVEYWMSRVAAVQLLNQLELTVEDEVRVRYELKPAFRQNPLDPISVNRGGRYLVCHGTGRFVVVGTVGDFDPPLDPPANPSAPQRAFQAYYLTELFSRLGECSVNPQHGVDVTDISQRTSTYFLWLNALLVLVATVFGGIYLWGQYGNNTIDAVVTARDVPQQEQLRDLSSLLQTDSTRPAVVVIGSGGGTRAAIYTASVLRGLHCLGADRDIVLLSGVSGGGVALAYFAANRDRLTVQSPPSQAVRCPDKGSANVAIDAEWDRFTKSVTKPFIEDVLNGATEWRIFRTTALSVLLAESFTKHLFPQNPTLGSLGTPLILNATVVSHPAEESDTLLATVDKAKTCAEAERTFKLMSGGRFIFTNLRETDAFPKRQSPIPDVRLPYQIVQDPNVLLANAAALNANFPPVFPNARVRLLADRKDGCEYRSYYVTDGGTQENLGLISALYALQSALAKIPNGVPARPIHVVIAEASAASYDYSQDRGISVALSDSRDRLAGGLTTELLEQIKPELERHNTTIQLHYLALPLAFRARGGFGTHWLYAKQFHLSDPRPRTEPWYNFLPLAALRDGKAVISRQDLEELWVALHDPDRFFCDNRREFKNPDAKKVQGWICGSPVNDPDGRDLHMSKWKKLVDALRAYQRP